MIINKSNNKSKISTTKYGRKTSTKKKRKFTLISNQTLLMIKRWGKYRT